MNSKEVLKIAGYTALTIAGMEIISRLSFSEGHRLEVMLRDKTCQVPDCQYPTKLTAHHIIPNSGIYRHTDYGGDVYSQPLKSALLATLDEIDDDITSKIWPEIKEFIGSPANGIILCETHHQQIHRGTIKVLPLVHNRHHRLRPSELSVETALEFQNRLIESIISRL